MKLFVSALMLSCSIGMAAAAPPMVIEAKPAPSVMWIWVPVLPSANSPVNCTLSVLPSLVVEP